MIQNKNKVTNISWGTAKDSKKLAKLEEFSFKLLAALSCISSFLIINSGVQEGGG